MSAPLPLHAPSCPRSHQVLGQIPGRALSQLPPQLVEQPKPHELRQRLNKEQLGA